jgi:hypothetical protein
VPETLSVVELLAFALIAAALIGLVPIECHDSNCRSVHRQHRDREREAKDLALHRASHGTYSSPGSAGSARKPVASEPVFYPDMACHLAPLRPATAPLDGCECRVCQFFRE